MTDQRNDLAHLLAAQREALLGSHSGNDAAKDSGSSERIDASNQALAQALQQILSGAAPAPTMALALELRTALAANRIVLYRLRAGNARALQSLLGKSGDTLYQRPG